MHIKRRLFEPVKEKLLHSGKIVLLYGPRQAGKTTLGKEIAKATGLRYLYINADQLRYIDVISSRDLNKLRDLTSGYELLFIDEGQRVPDIGLNLKILHDELPQLKVMVTGSSSFLLSGRVNESLAGRKKVFTLLPLSTGELLQHYNPFELSEQLTDRLIFGSYPEILNLRSTADKLEYLRDVSTSYIFKDILELENIRYPYKINDLLKLLAWQTGAEVSIHELCQKLSLNRETVERYLNLLEQSFIIFKLRAFSRNPRKEISKSVKYYFYDTGIRNVLIDNMNPPDQRNDIGGLWENYLIAERKKYLLFEGIHASQWFWRTYSGTEIDYIEERDGKLFAYEIKYRQKKASAPPSWKENYGHHFESVNSANYTGFLNPKKDPDQ
ncbi:hypothetical protein CYPRO_2836 [Cyclonatronum proteinivorum]|uniref:AAA+ ATPase domain-containing protein n=1 Tax=Cyclonatronum proteinivorum TaxID=1457365 RepID=A0A345UNM2_9BACT|nr:ATP-binding protein [Cyclonatronum proteinivorum]AXJ02074.1 hypothetical protein CYPRO_2836 [Cyclonatronum proteinivorum]